MIQPEQLADALERLDPRERELLALSLRRRVPDEALARVYDVDAQEVARRRAGAIERLADELGAQRGEDLGAVLQALLDEGTWSAAELETAREVEPGGAESRSDGAGDPESRSDGAADLESRSDGSGAPEPEDALEPEAGGAPVRDAQGAPAPDGEEPDDRREPDPEAPQAEEPARSEPAESVEPVSARAAVEERAPAERESSNGHPPVVPVASEPVLEMLAAREGLRGPDGRRARKAPRDRRRVPYLLILGSFIAALLGGAAALFASSEWGEDGGTSTAAQGPEGGTRHFVPQLGGPLEAPFPSEPQSIACYSTAFVDGPATLYHVPGGRERIQLSARTEWASDRVFGVVLRRGDWIAVQAPELGNGELGWMPAKRARLDCVTWSMHADLSRRTMSVRRNGDVVRTFEIAIGRRDNPTPKGRFSVTDKLRVTDQGSPYGCCVLALTGHQTRLPESWPGGDRLAIHATKELSSLGRPASLGCMRVTSAQARWLIETMPLGAPLFVRA